MAVAGIQGDAHMGVNHQAIHACLGLSWQQFPSRSSTSGSPRSPLVDYSSPNEENSAGALEAMRNPVGQVMYGRHQLGYPVLHLCPDALTSEAHSRPVSSEATRFRRCIMRAVSRLEPVNNGLATEELPGRHSLLRFDGLAKIMCSRDVQLGCAGGSESRSPRS